MPFDVGNFVFVTVLLSLVVPLIITVAVIGTVVWAIRRAMHGPSAEEELRARLARGEISPTEYQADEDVLRQSRG